MNLFLCSEVRRVQKEFKAAFTARNVHRVLIIDSAQDYPDPDRGGSMGKLLSAHGMSYQVADPLTEDLPNLAQFDALHMSGGNPFKLLLAAQKSALQEKIEHRAQEGAFCVSGSSAGAMVCGSTLRHIKDLAPHLGIAESPAFGWLPSPIMPHYDQNGRFADRCRERVAAVGGDWILINERDFQMFTVLDPDLTLDI